jgi:hypothetical protein
MVEKLAKGQKSLDNRILSLSSEDPYMTLIQYGDLLSVQQLEKIAGTFSQQDNVENGKIQAVIRLSLLRQVLRGIPNSLQALKRHTQNYHPNDTALCLTILTYAAAMPEDLEALNAIISMHIHSTSGLFNEILLAFGKEPTSLQKQAVAILQAVQPLGDQIFETLLENPDDERDLPIEWGYIVSNRLLREIKQNHSTQTDEDILIRALIGSCQLYKAAMLSDEEAEADFRKGNVRQFISDLILSGLRDSEIGEEAIEQALEVGINIAPHYLGPVTLVKLSNQMGGKDLSHPFIPASASMWTDYHSVPEYPLVPWRNQ